MKERWCCGSGGTKPPGSNTWRVKLRWVVPRRDGVREGLEDIDSGGATLRGLGIKLVNMS